MRPWVKRSLIGAGVFVGLWLVAALILNLTGYTDRMKSEDAAKAAVAEETSSPASAVPTPSSAAPATSSAVPTPSSAAPAPTTTEAVAAAAVPAYVAPPADPNGVPPCPVQESWDVSPTGAGVVVFVDSDPGAVSATVRTKSGADTDQAAAIKPGESMHEFEFPSIDKTDVQEILISTAAGRCYAPPSPTLAN